MKSILQQFVSRLSATFREKEMAVNEKNSGATPEFEDSFLANNKRNSRNAFRALALFLFFGASHMQGQTILTWNTFGNAGTETTEPSTSNTNVAAATLNYTGSSVTAAANGNRFGGSNWGLATFSTANYIQFTVTPNAGFSFTPTSFSFIWDFSGTGPKNVVLRSSADSFGADLGSVLNMTTSTATVRTITISGLSNITAATTFRLYGYGATSAAGTGGFDCAASANNVILNGTTAATGSPVISVTGTPLSAVNTTYGTASASPTSFKVSGSNTTEGILVTPPAGFEVSLSIAGTYSNTLVVGSAGTIPSTTVYVRLKSTATVAGSPYSGDVVCSTAGATSVNVATVSSTVSPLAITITGATASNKIYNRTTAATITGATASGTVNSDVITVSGGGTFDNFNVGTAKPVTAALSLSGTNATSYSFTQPIGLSADITPKDLTVTGASANNKVYNGNTGATLSGTLSGVISPDDVSVILDGGFDSPSVGTAIPVTSFSSITGVDIANYNFINPTGLSANITPKALTIAGATALNKVYDGTTSAVITGTLTGVIDPDFVTFNGIGVFDSPEIGLNIPVTSVSTITGDTDNYTLVQPTGLTANISAGELLEQTITFDPLATATYGDANIALTATSDSSLAVSYSSSDPSVATIVAGVSPGTYEMHIVGVGFTTITATQSGDGTYDAAMPVDQMLFVNQKELIVTESAANKVYDGNDIAVVTGSLSGIIGTDDVEFVGAGNFISVQAGNAIDVYPNSTLSGVDAAKYFINETILSADITPKALTVTGAIANNKAYNGTTAATISGATLQGVIAPDTVTVSGGGTFASKNVGTGIAVTAALTLGGTNAGNYTLTQPTGLTANITAIALTISGVSGVNKVYDRTTAATLSGAPVLNGVIGTDDVSVSGTPTAFFANKTVANAKTITVTGYTLSGTDAVNYTITQPTGITADITPFSLTIFNAAAVNKVFDGTTAAIITGTLVGTIGADVVTLNGTGTFASSAVGTNIAVTSISTIGGADGPNYIINPQPTGLTANITAAPTYLGTQDFEVVPATPTLTFTTSDTGSVGSGSGFITGQTTVSDAPSGANYFSGGSRGYQVYPTSSVASRVITFSSVDASSYSNLQASFRIACLSVTSTGNGIDNTTGTTILGAATPVDFALIEVSPDGGTTWYKQAVLSTSGSNARWAFTGTGTGTRSYAANNTYSNYVVAGSNTVVGATAITTAVVTSLPAVSNLAIRITLESNAVSERWVIDDVNISGVLGSACTTPDPITSLSATNGSSLSAVSWTYGTCYDEAIIVASTSAFTSAVPTGDGTAYTVTSQSFTDAGNSSFDGGKVVYKGSASTATITSLTNGSTYNFKVFVRKGTNWTSGDVTSATPVEAQYFWDADGAASAATGGTGTWDSASTSNWRTPNATGSLAPWVTNTTPLNATIAGTAGTITLPSTITTPVAPNLYINTTGYTFAATGTTAITIPAANTVLADNVQLTFSPNVNNTIPANGSFNMGSISAGINSGITLNAAQSTSGAVSQRINLSRANSVITAPVTIVSTGGTGSATVAALVATATGTSLSSTATITNNTAIKTGIGATSGFDLVANGVISGSADLIFAAGAAGGAGTVTLSALNTYTGATLFNLASTGIIKLGINNALPTATNLTMGYSSANGGILDLNGFNQTIGSLSNGAGGGSIRNNALATDAALTVNGASSTTFGLAITDGTSKTALVKMGAGTLTLSGVNTYTGGTTISGGAIQLGAAGVLANTGAVTLNGGSFATAGFTEAVGALNLNSTGTIALGSGNHTLTFANSSAVSWAGSLLTVTGWNGTAGQSNTAGGKIQVGVGGLTSGQLSKISFTGYAGTPIILASGELVPSGPHLIVTGATDHGVACVGSAANYIDYTITNTGATASNISIVSDNTEFVVSNIPAEVLGGSSATYRITFTPSVSGARSATITITTSTPNNNNPIVSNVSGTGNISQIYYADTDGDTYGDASVAILSCIGVPTGYSVNNTDCNDADVSVYQSGLIYIDADGDHWDAGQATVCYGATAPTGYSLTTLGTDCDDTDALITTCSTSAIVNLKMFIQGYYNGTGMVAARYDNLTAEGSPAGNATDVDEVTVELHDGTSLAVAYTVTGMLQTDGTMSLNFPAGAVGNSYYIVLKHRNSLQLWSANPVLISATTSYDFSTGLDQAYTDGSFDPMAMLAPGVYGMYTGDLNQDDFIDAADYPVYEADVDNSANLGLYLLSSDFNGDTFVDAADYPVFDVNSSAGLFAQYPQP